MQNTNKAKEELIKVIEEVESLSEHAAEMERMGIDYKRTGLAVQKARKYAESIVETVSEPLIVLDDNLRVSSANRSFYQAFKATAEETVGQLIYELGNHQWDISKLRELLMDILPKNTTLDDFEVECHLPNIGQRALLLNARQLYREEDNTQMILLTIEDITEHRQAEEELRGHRERLEELVKERTAEIRMANEQLQQEITERQRAEAALRESEERYRDLFENTNDIIQSVTPDGHFLYVNRAWREVLGYSEEETQRLSLLDIIHPDSQAQCMEVFQYVLSGENVGRVEATFVTKNGKEIMVEGSVNCRFVDGKPTYTRGIFRDISERKQTEEKVKHAAEEWRTTFDSITDLVSIHDKDLRLIRVNKAFANSLKMEPAELIGKTCYELVHKTNEPPPSCPHVQTLATKEPVTVGYFEPHLGIHLEVTTSPIFNEKGRVVGSVHVARDTTQRKRMEEQLIIADRLASVGELAAGIAHELNNPLTSVIGFSQLLLDRNVAGDVKEDLKVVYSEAQRAAEVMKNLLTFAGKHTPVKQPVNINSVIDKVLELRAYEQRVHNIRVNTRFAPDLPEIMADYFQLQQVFLNIIINAEHFMMAAHKRGTLTITTEITGNIVKASLTDDGPGIPKENLGHLFDPFFTTKEVGKGTGLGLSICHGIITERGGMIYAESDLGKGATFVVELPISSY